MPKVSVDMTQAADTIPAGPYPVRVVEAEMKMPKVKPDAKPGEAVYPYAALTCIVQEGDYTGYRLRTIISFNPKAAFKLKEFLKAVGLYDESMGNKFDVDTDDWLSKPFTAMVDDETYNEQMRSGIKNFLPENAEIAASTTVGETETPRRRPRD